MECSFPVTLLVSLYRSLRNLRRRAPIVVDLTFIGISVASVGWLEWFLPLPSSWLLLLTPAVLYVGTFYSDSTAWVLSFSIPILFTIFRGLHDPSASAVAMGVASWSVIHFGCCTLLLSGWKAAARRAAEVSERDTLTGAGNSTSYFRTATAAIKRCRERGQPLTIAVMDCDQFKRINDTHGHLAGDELLKLLARRIESALRPDDRLIRWGGDEFVLILPDCAVKRAEESLEQIQSDLRSAMNSLAYAITFSWGVIIYDVPPDDAEALLRDADRLMYSAKNAGGGQVSLRHVPGDEIRSRV
ncbi:MAG: GGDEF domain-containing protein [Planctomycetaceae bacterium]